MRIGLEQGLAVNINTGAADTIPVQCKYVVKLYILMFGHQAHGQVVQIFHQLDHGIKVLGKQDAG